jgi:alanine racemase
MRSTKALVSLALLRENIRAVRARIGPNPLICFPVKADGYGHGAIQVSQTAISAGVQYLAVATVSEGTELRSAGITAPILLLSVPSVSELPTVVNAHLIPFVADRDFVSALSRIASELGKRVSVHLKIDTGMGRVGCRPESAAELAAFIVAQSSLELAGTATHFAVADSCEPRDVEYTEGQLRRFREAVEAIRAAGISPGIVHSANSGAVTLHENAFFDMIRPGIILYGYPPKVPSDWPSEGAVALARAIRPIMTVVTEIAFVKRVKPGECVSYGCLWTAERETWIATLPLGYADGLRRDLMGKLKVYIREKPFPVVGKICMDQCMVDCGENAFERGEPVTVFGGVAPDAGDVAALVGTISYEITCGINKRVVRVYINE